MALIALRDRLDSVATLGMSLTVVGGPNGSRQPHEGGKGDGEGCSGVRGFHGLLTVWERLAGQAREPKIGSLTHLRCAKHHPAPRQAPMSPVPDHDFRTHRLFVEPDLAPDAMIDLDRAQANYLLNALRMKEGSPVLVFNGRDGEWRARLRETGRKAAYLLVDSQARTQPTGADLHFLFAPLRRERMEWMVEKAVEMGAGIIRPVVTDHVQKVNLKHDRLAAHAREAAEQCGVLAIPPIEPLSKLANALDGWDPARKLIFCDERSDGRSPLDALAALRPGPLAVLIGPEGGFSPAERERLLTEPFVTPVPLGPRILRADTAAVAALALIQSTIGDWPASQ